MLTNDQKALLKRGQAQAGIEDAEYRDILDQLTGCRSSTDARLGDSHLDTLLAYFEAIYWREFDDGRLAAPGRNAVFRRRGYWAGKNALGNTSRDRFNERELTEAIALAERDLGRLGYGSRYLAGIQRRTGSGRMYLAALQRTIRSKQHEPASC